MKQRLLAIVATLVLVVPSLAAAQGTPWSPPRFTAGWVFTPAMTFGTEWDDNVTLRGNGSDTPTDSVLLFRPRGELDFNGRRARFSTGYQGAWARYQTLSDLDRFDQRARAEARYIVSPTITLQTRATASLVPSTDLLEINGVPFARVGARLIDVTGGVVGRPAQRTELGADYHYQNVDFDSAVLDRTFLRGGYSNGVSAHVGYDVAPRVSIGARYDLRDATITDGGNNFLIQNALGTVSVTLGPGTRVSGGGGLAYLNMRSTGETRVGPSFKGDFSQTVRRAVISAAFERSFIPAYGFGGTTRNEVLSASVLVPMMRGRLFWYAGASARRAEPLLGISPKNVNLESYWLTTSVGYGVSRWLRVEGVFNGTYQNSLLPGGRVERNRFGIRLTTSKPMRIQ